MSQEIIDLNSMKYRKVYCPYCGAYRNVDINNIFEDEYEEKIVEYICNNCDDVFTLAKEEEIYEAGTIDEDKWHDLTDDHKCMLGINEEMS
ncbi:hypothetical protein [Clostridium butyricum]|uniref:hypothetical protein n=1 Tax=Clostridium butyricum TaxID=1492 RepID=UPI002ABE04E3|nr:hypothetical protein [Clostridium butyricum]